MNFTTFFAASAVALLATTGVTTTAMADDAPDPRSEIMCPVLKEFENTQTHILTPAGEARTISVQSDAVTLRVDGWNYNSPGHRANIGAREDVTVTSIDLSIDNGQFRDATPTPVSPAFRFTDPFSTESLVEPPGPVILEAGSTDFTWVDSAFDMPQNSSMYFGFTPVVDDRSEPIEVTMYATGYYWDMEPCNDGPVSGVADQCSLNWNLASTFDKRMPSPSTDGFQKVVTDTSVGWAALQKFSFNPSSLSWRVPVAFDHDVEAGAQLVLSAGENWTFDSTYSNISHRFHDFSTLNNDPLNPTIFPTTVDGDILVDITPDSAVVTLPAIEAGSHLVLQFPASPVGGTVLGDQGYAITGQLTGTYAEDVCPDPVIPQPIPVVPAEPTGVNPSADDPAQCTVAPFATVTPSTGVIYRALVDGEEITADASGRYFYEYGQTITIEALPLPGYRLVGETGPWSWTAIEAEHCLDEDEPIDEDAPIEDAPVEEPVPGKPILDGDPFPGKPVDSAPADEVTLPRTGADSATLAALGASALLGGLVLMTAVRRKNI